MTVDRKRLEDALRDCKAPSDVLIAEAMGAIEPFFALAESGGDFPLPCTLVDPDSYDMVLEDGLKAMIHKVRFVSLRSDPFPVLEWHEGVRNSSSVEKWYFKYLPKMTGDTRKRIRALDHEFAKALYGTFHVNVLNKPGVWPEVPVNVRVILGANTFAIIDRFMTLVGLGHEAGARQLLPVVRHLPSIVPLGEDATVQPFVPGHWIVLSG
ncbi:MAG: hypothetical protein U9Q03_03095 [Patescibacteria group bacterium]|nr:hypothetical protein [Patescibacteria group bacterium]